MDYHLASPSLAETARTAVIYKDVKFSDHAPLTIDYDFDL
jgi:exodeoxyribonuclease-3